MKTGPKDSKFMGGLDRKNPSNAGDPSRQIGTSTSTVNDGTRDATAKTNKQPSREA